VLNTELSKSNKSNEDLTRKLLSLQSLSEAKVRGIMCVFVFGVVEYQFHI